MCIICVDFERGALRLNEARRALREMSETLPPEHVREVERKLATPPAAAPAKPASKP